MQKTKKIMTEIWKSKKFARFPLFYYWTCVFSDALQHNLRNVASSSIDEIVFLPFHEWVLTGAWVAIRSPCSGARTASRTSGGEAWGEAEEQIGLRVALRDGVRRPCSGKSAPCCYCACCDEILDEGEELRILRPHFRWRTEVGRPRWSCRRLGPYASCFALTCTSGMRSRYPSSRASSCGSRAGKKRWR